ncbi:MAG: 50S ribosomal protein L4 [Syntrophaceticus sp.]|nr:50S ribosomal protein L4 [Syntrophaceticus sp.]MDD4359931.1 50S ribosomal protein L4 [Syntrophaceticus sp.]MDD4782159.1 50S ribosomal protein L4 [Syntrophaceticus sp.]HBG23378.1 50S ribosomal protein L4 [Peptococcaceae bacterium]
MPKAALYNAEGERTGDIDLRDDVFGVPIKEDILHQAVVRHLANQRAGTAAVKNRGEVRGGGRKPWRQKGTGRARVGSIRSPIWRGGGIVFGPQPRSYKQAMPRKMRRLALKSALSVRAAEGELVVIEDFKLSAPKTKEAIKLLDSLDAAGNILLVANEEIPEVILATRNIPGVFFRLADHLSAYDVLAADKVVMTSQSMTRIEEVLSDAQPS